VTKIIFFKLFFLNLLFVSKLIAFDSTTQYTSAYSEIMMEHSVYQGLSEESDVGTNVTAALFTHITPFMPFYHTVMTNFVGPEVRRRINNKNFKHQTEKTILALRTTKKNIHYILNAEDQVLAENPALYLLMEKLAVALKDKLPVLDHYNLPYPYNRDLEFRMQTEHSSLITGYQEILITDREFFMRGMIYQAIGKEYPESTTEKLIAFAAYCDALEKILMPYSGKTIFEKKYFQMNNINSAIKDLTEARALIKSYLDDEAVEENTINSLVLTAMRMHDPLSYQGSTDLINLFETVDYADQELAKNIKLDFSAMDLNDETKAAIAFKDKLEEYDYLRRHRWGFFHKSFNFYGANVNKQIAVFISVNFFEKKEGIEEHFQKKLKDFNYHPPSESAQVLKLALLCDQTLAQLYQLKNKTEQK